ncbi:MAG: hypothetical protein JWP74_1013 [Marmoricola sp.]|nr:hypothetical protein [Marmoricola sp.]
MTHHGKSPRHVLAPGLYAHADGAGRIRIGNGIRAVLELPASPGLRRALAAVDRGEAPPGDASTRRAVRLLAPVLVEADRLIRPGIDPGDAAAAAADEPVLFTERLQARCATRVAVVGDLGARADPGALLASTGMVVTSEDDGPDIVLLLALGETDRDRTDPWTSAGVPHLPVRAIGAEVVLGPLVVPGRTACLRCVDAHRIGQDPGLRRALTLHLDAVRHDGVATPRDSALAALATAWAVRDLVSLAEGRQPSTWSTTLTFGADLSEVDRTTWPRHPDCGCVWATDAA